jgi:hypothetical protein
MKTTVIESGKTNGVSNKAENNAKGNGNGVIGNGALSLSKSFDTAKVETVKEVKAIAAVEAPKVEVSEIKPMPPKVELRDQMAVQKPALNLESTLKLVEELHRRKIQRDKLIGTIDSLDEFEVAQKNDAEETDSNHFQRCELTIEDDQRREFVTKNPVIIKKVAEYIQTLCVDRLAEIEGEIFLPA